MSHKSLRRVAHIAREMNHASGIVVGQAWAVLLYLGLFDCSEDLARAVGAGHCLGGLALRMYRTLSLVFC